MVSQETVDDRADLRGPPQGRRNPWLVFLAPLVVFMAIGALEPTPPKPGASLQSQPGGVWPIAYSYYPLIYSLKIVATVAVLIYVWPGVREVNGSLGASGIVVGVVGAVAWIALAWGQRYLAQQWGITFGLGERSAFNPFAELGGQTPRAYGFLAVRLAGLVLVVPVIEEIFLRGLVMRYPVAADWWNVPLGKTDTVGFAASVIVPVLMHPQEAVAAAVWFGAVAWLMVRSRSLWDCVVAHAVTNLLLGVYVLATGAWWLM